MFAVKIIITLLIGDKMHILFLIIQIIINPFENFFSKQYNAKTKHFNLCLFTAATVFGSAFYFLLSIGFHVLFVKELLIYAFLFAVSFAGTALGSVLAFKYGFYATTMLIQTYSNTIPTIFGILFLHETVGLPWYCGFALTCISIYVLNSVEKEEGSFSFRWLFWLSVSFISNGIAVIVMKLQQVRFNGVYDNLFMFYAMFPLAIVLFIASIFKSKNFRFELKDALLYGIPRGSINGISNFFTMMLLGMIPTAVYFPMMNSFSLVGTCLISVIFFKEKFSNKKIIACFLGLVAGVLLNI